ncbi:hypothetical protein NDN08_006083 [Rhodosorus marinus]|uniref:Uncharacterized protein n=1 Tax=Rhodosorus marinus TaxID=101924 RepID=A0AAV8UJP8_9RHOD|nr:hypothetical protein NDN08_006083 [Rhodosorus marinus]
MGLLGVVLWDIPGREPLLVRLVRGGLGPEQTRDVLLKFSAHCDSLQGIATTPEEVIARWDPPPRISYTVVEAKYRVIVLWNDSEPMVDTATDANYSLGVMRDCVSKNSAGLGSNSDKSYSDVYKASGDALLLSEIEKSFFDEAEIKKRGLSGGLGGLFGTKALSKDVTKPKPKKTEAVAPPREPRISAEGDAKPKPKNRLIPSFGIGRRGKKQQEDSTSRDSGGGAPKARISRGSSQRSVPQDIDDGASNSPRPAAVKGTFLDSSDDENPPEGFGPPQSRGPPPGGFDGPPDPVVSGMGSLSVDQVMREPPMPQGRKELINRVGDLMTQGDFQAALTAAKDAIGAGRPDPDLALAVFYSFALELILRMQIAESKGQNSMLGVAFLSSALAELPLLPRQRTGARLMAAQKHMMVGNYGLASSYAKSVIPDADPDQKEKIQRVVLTCQQHGDTNVRVPTSSKLCFMVCHV